MKAKDLKQLAAEISLAEAKQLLQEKERQAARIERLRETQKSLLEKLDAVTKEIESLEKEAGVAPARGKKRGRKKGQSPARKASGKRAGKTFRQLVVEYMTAKKRAPYAEIVDAVAQAKLGGPATPSAKVTVSKTLSSEKSIKRIGRGIYQLVEADGAAAEPVKKKTTKKASKKATPAKPEATT